MKYEIVYVFKKKLQIMLMGMVSCFGNYKKNHTLSLERRGIMGILKSCMLTDVCVSVINLRC